MVGNKILTAAAMAGGLFDIRDEQVMLSSDMRLAPDHKAICRVDTGEVHGIVGSTFESLSHKQALSGIDSALPELEQKHGPATVKAELDWMRKRGTGNTIEGTNLRVHVEFRNSPASINGLFPTIDITHGLGGTGGLDVSAGVYRLICSNGMITGEKTMQRKMRHTPGIRYRIENVEALLVRAVNAMQGEAEFQQKASRVAVSTEETTKALFYALTGKTESERLPRGFSEIRQAYYYGDGANAGTGNGIWQAATNYATHQYGNNDGNDVRRDLFNSTSPGAHKIRQRARKLVSLAITKQEQGTTESMTAALITV